MDNAGALQISSWAQDTWKQMLQQTLKSQEEPYTFIYSAV